jgi:hypothetical protein
MLKKMHGFEHRPSFEKLKEIEGKFQDIPKIYEFFILAFVKAFLNFKKSEEILGYFFRFIKSNILDLTFFQIIIMRKMVESEDFRFDFFAITDNLEYFFKTLINFFKNSENISDYLKDDFADLLELIETKIFSKVKEIHAQFVDQLLTERQLNYLKDNLPIFNQILELFNKKVTEKELSDQLDEFKNSKKTKTRLNTLAEWLRKNQHNVIFTSSTYSTNLRDTINQIKTMDQDIKKSGIDLSVDHQEAIEYFSTRKSVLFKSMFNEKRKTNFEKKPLNEIISDLVEMTLLTLQKFCSDGLTMNDIKSEGRVILKEIGHENVTLEDQISILLNHFPSSNSELSEKKILDALEYVDTIQLLPDVLSCFKKYQMKKCENYLQNSKFSDDIKINEVSAKLIMLKENFRLRNFHFKFISELVNVKPLVTTLRNLSDFDNRISILSNNEGIQNHSIILDLKASYPFICLLFSPDTDYNEICEALLPLNEKQIKQVTKSIFNAFSHNEKIEYWFSQIDGLSINNVKLAIEKLYYGEYKSVISEEENFQLIIEYSWKDEKNEVLNEERLIDFVRKAIFCHESEVNETVEKHLMKEFEESYKIAEKANQLRKRLNISGHPEFQSKVFCLGKVSNLGDIISRLEKSLNKWENEINKTVERIPKILKLRKKQFIRFFNLVNKKTGLSDSEMGEIKMMIFQIYFEEFKDLKPSSPNEMINLFLTKVQEQKIGTIISELKKKEEFEKVIEFTQCIFAKFQIKEKLIDITNEEIEKSKILNFSNFDSEKDLLLQIDRNILEDLFTEYFHQLCQFINCESASAEEIEWFSKRRKKFPHLKYIIFQPEKDEKKILFNDEISNLKLNSFYIFKNPLWISSYSFLDSHQATKPNFDMFVKKEYEKRSRKLLNDGSLTVVVGESLAGKTRFIQDDAKSKSLNLLKISVNEDFSAQVFIDWLKKKNVKQLAVHFNVTDKNSLSKLDALFFNFFYCGIWTDENDGNILFLNQDLKLIIYVEFPNEIQEIENICPVISIFSHEKRNIKISETEFLFDSKAQEVAKFIHSYQRSSLKDLNQNIELQLTKKILNEYFAKISKTRYHQVLFIEMMYERCQHIRNCIQTDVHFEDAVLFDYLKHYLRESEALSIQSGNLTSTVFTSYTFGAFPSFDLIDPNKDLIKDNNHNQLRSSVGLLAGDSSIARKVLIPKNYVLTPDFALKLMILNGKRKSGQNVIISGGTGVGKTELLHIFIELLNYSSHFRPSTSIMVDFFKGYFEKVQKSIVNSEDLIKFKKLIEKYADSHQIIFLNQIIESICADPEDGTFEPLEKLKKFSKDLFSQNSIIPKFINDHKMINFSKETQNLANGTTSIENLTQLLTTIKDIEKAPPKGIFYQIMMHPGWKITQLRKTFESIIKEHITLKEIHPDLKTIIFIDELNTSNCLGFLKEIMVERTMDGQPFPDSLFFIGAINPDDNTKKETEELVYIVNKLPSSMEKIVLEFGELSTKQQTEFIQYLFKSEFCAIHTYLPENNKNQISDNCEKLLLFCQRFVQDKQPEQERIRVSIRDIMRFIKLYEFFGAKNFLKYSATDAITIHWTNMITSLALTYYFRLNQKNRAEFVIKFDEQLKQLKIFGTSLALKSDCMENIIAEQLSYFYDSVNESGSFTEGISKTRSLMENLFCNFICLQTKTPLLISGPPGTSKTLSYQIASKLRKLQLCKHNEKFSFVKSINGANYQCTEYSTSEEIESVFNSRIDLFENLMMRNDENEIVSIFMDETGLPQEKKHALKVIHYYLDHPKVSSVLISNTILDAAKTNRTLHLQQGESTREDLKHLADGILNQEGSEKFIDGIIEAYLGLNDIVHKIDSNLRKQADFFQMRDFVFFLRLLHETQNISNENIYYCIQRHFNGVSKKCFDLIAKKFFDELNKRDKKYFMPEKQLSYIDLLRESVNQKYHHETSISEDPNQSSFRYILLIDPGNIETSIRLLASEKILQNNYEICSVSDFPSDDNLFSKSQEISKIKLAMEVGKTLILINSSSINTNFYDVFNRQFSIVKKNVEGKEKLQYFANVAVGALSSQCPVDEKFHIIVHMPLEEVKNAPLPFLNRFEKYQLGYSNILDDYLLNHGNQKLIYDTLNSGMQDFVEKMLPQSFIGLSKAETVSSFLVRLFGEKLNGIPLIENPFQKLEPYKDQNVQLNQDSYSQMQRCIRFSNYFLLSVLTPQAVYTLRNILPKPYIQQYLEHQEHFSFIKFFKQLGKSYFEGNNDHLKWIVYTRPSKRIASIFVDPEQKSKLFDFGAGDQSNDCSFISFESFQSKVNCNTFLQKFIESKKKVLLVTVDLKHTSQSQLNYLRYQIDQQIKDQLVVFIIQNYPQIPPYDVVYLNNWEYLYVDAFDYSILEYKEEKLNPSYWFSVAVSLKRFNSDLIQELNPLFDQLQFKENNVDGFDKNKWMKDIITQKFKEFWLDKVFPKILQNACDSVLTGSDYRSLLELIYSGLERLFNGMCSYFVDTCSKYNNLGIDYDLTDKDSLMLQKIATNILLDTFDVSPDFILNYQSPLKKPEPLKLELPFSHILLEKLEEEYKVSLHLKKSKYRHINRLIEENPRLFAKVERDFINKEFQICSTENLYQELVSNFLKNRYSELKVENLFKFKFDVDINKRLRLIRFYLVNYGYGLEIDDFNEVQNFSDYPNFILTKSVENLRNLINEKEKMGMKMDDWCKKFKNLRSLLHDKIHALKSLKEDYYNCSLLCLQHSLFPNEQVIYQDNLLNILQNLKPHPNNRLFLQSIINDIFLTNLPEALKTLIGMLQSTKHPFDSLNRSFRAHCLNQILNSTLFKNNPKDLFTILNEFLETKDSILYDILPSCFLKNYKFLNVDKLLEDVVSLNPKTNLEKIYRDTLIDESLVRISEQISKNISGDFSSITKYLREIKVDEVKFMAHFNNLTLENLVANGKMNLEIIDKIKDIESGNEHILPLIYEDPIKDDYKMLKDSFSNEQNLKKTIQNTKNKFQTRMIVFLICYYEFFRKNKGCQILLSLLKSKFLKDALSLNDIEEKCFLFYANGPIQNYNEDIDSDLKFGFSSKIFSDSKSDKKTADILSNIIAVTLGSPREKNHLYTRAFKPHDLLTSSISPGSTVGSNADCGYQTSLQKNTDVFQMATSNHILQGSPLYHSALNTLTFGAMSMCFLFDPKVAFQGKSLCSYYLDNIKDIPELTKVEIYVKTRFDTFYRIFEHNLSLSHTISPLLFFSSALSKFYFEIPQKNYSHSTFNRNDDTIRSYENGIAELCFKPVLNDSKSIIEKSMKFVKHNEIQEKINKTRIELKNKKISLTLFPQIGQVQNIISSYQTEDSKSIIKFTNMMNGMHFLLKLPLFVRFYNLVHNILNKKLPKSDLYKPIIEVVEEYGIPFLEWQEFKNEWNNYKPIIIQTLNSLGYNIDCNRLETSTEVFDDSPLINFLYVDEFESNSTDISRLIEQMIMIYNDFPFRSSDSPEIDCNFIPIGYENLLSYDLNNLDSIWCSAFDTKNDIQEFNTEIIKSMIMDRTLKPLLKEYKFQKFHFKDETAIESIERYGLTSPMWIHKLYELMESIKYHQFFKNTQKISNQKFNDLVDNVDLETLKSFVHLFIKIIETFKMEQLETISEEMIKLNGIKYTEEECHVIKDLRLNELLLCSQYVLDRYLNYDSFEISVLHGKIPIPRRVKKEFDNNITKILDQDKILQKLVQPLGNLLKEISHSKELGNQLKMKKSFRDVFEKEISQCLTISGTDKKYLQLLFPSDILLENANQYLHTLNMFIGKLNLKIYQNQQIEHIYEEKIPQEFGEEYKQNEIEMNQIIESEFISEDLEKLKIPKASLEEIMEIKNELNIMGVEENKEDLMEIEEDGVEKWLESLKLGQYTSNFIDNGFDDLGDLLENGLNEDDYKVLKLKKGHENKIRRMLQKK